MNYKQMNIETLSTGQEAISNLLIAAGAGGFEVIDPQDFQEFLDTVTPHWDYVDDELLKLQDAESGDFVLANLSEVDWISFAVVTVVCLGAAILLHLADKTEKKNS